MQKLKICFTTKKIVNMNNTSLLKNISVFQDYLLQSDKLAIAVSGGVDSTSLALLMSRLVGGDKERIVWAHAKTPAVPLKHTQKLESIAKEAEVNLKIISPDEFNDERYLRNPIDRCFYCKFNLFEEIVKQFPSALVLTGANHDDLGDFRPGLKAAEQFQVQHAFIKAGYGKDDIRFLARILGLSELASAPSSPCLSSRVFTGTRIDPVVLGKIEKIEEMMAAFLGIGNHRCRYGTGQVVLEIDPEISREVTDAITEKLKILTAELFGLAVEAVLFRTYQRGNGYATIIKTSSTL